MAVSHVARRLAEDEPAADVGGGWIQHSPNLIAELTAEHAVLVRQYSELGELVMRGDYEAIAPALDDFRRAFEAHLLDENLRFYCYLERRLAGKSAELVQIQQGRTELTAIAREISAFLRKYRGAGVRYANGKAFLDELHCVGALLVHRVAREENDLFPLYCA